MLKQAPRLILAYLFYVLLYRLFHTLFCMLIYTKFHMLFYRMGSPIPVTYSAGYALASLLDHHYRVQIKGYEVFSYDYTSIFPFRRATYDTHVG